MSRTTSINVNINKGKSVANLKQIEDGFKRLNTEYKKLGKKGKIDIGINNNGMTTASINSLNKQLAQLTNNLTNIKQSGKNASVGVQEVGKSVGATSGNIALFGANMLSASLVIRSMTTKIKELSQEFNNLNSSSFNVGIASQMSIEQIGELNTAFLKMSSSVPSTAKELADAIDGLIRSGRGFDESKQIIEQVALLSTASGDSLKDTASVVTKVMVALNIGANETERTLNAMHSTAIQTASDMKYLAEGFKNVAGTASVLVGQSGLVGEELKEYKQDVLDLSMASIGALANLGLSAS